MKPCVLIRCVAAGEKQRNQAQKISLQQQLIARRGGVVQGIESMIPLCWNKKVQVVRYE